MIEDPRARIIALDPSDAGPSKTAPRQGGLRETTEDRENTEVGHEEGVRIPAPGRRPGSKSLRGFDQLAHGLGRVVEHLLLAGVEGDLDDLFHALAAQDDGHADVEVAIAVLAAQVGRAGD